MFAANKATMNFMIDGDDGSDCQSPSHQGCDRCEGEVTTTCDICFEDKPEDTVIRLNLTGEDICSSCCSDHLNASDLIHRFIGEAAGDWSPEDSYEVRREVRSKFAGKIAPSLKEAKAFFTTFDQDLYEKILNHKYEQSRNQTDRRAEATVGH